MNSATLRLFNGIMYIKYLPKLVDYEETNKRTISKGYILDAKLISYKTKDGLFKIKKAIEDYVVSFEKWNNSFYKSWKKLEELSDYELKRDQLIHYFTTYNYSDMGIDIDKFMYVPEGEVKLPEQLKFIYIRALTEVEIIERLDKMLSSGIALKPETQEDILTILGELDYSKVLPVILRNKNKELDSKFAERFDIIPKDPTKFLRYVIQLSTGNSLVIKNEEVISAIKMADNDKEVIKAFIQYKTNYTYNVLAESFYRYKPLWLAFKAYPKLKPVINKIRRLAVKNHKPMPKDLLNDITGMLRRGEDIYRGQFDKALEKANTFRKVRLLYALKNMESEEVVYKVRNGKSYATKRSIDFDMGKGLEIYMTLYRSIVEDLRKNVENKTVRTDPQVNYALPATEKQFIGNYPSGTSIKIDGDAVVGVHWENQNNEQTDLDLSLINISGEKIGWDGMYRTSSVQFSGDLTNAPLPKGASEFFYFKGIENGLYLLQLNFYNYLWNEFEDDCPFDIVVASSEEDNVEDMNSMFDPNNTILTAKSYIGQSQKVLGIVRIEDGKSTFFFSESKVNTSMTAIENGTSEIQRNFMLHQLKNSISLENMLLDAGATIANSSDSDIDLSADGIDKDTILKMFYKES